MRSGGAYILQIVSRENCEARVGRIVGQAGRGFSEKMEKCPDGAAAVQQIDEFVIFFTNLLTAGEKCVKINCMCKGMPYIDLIYQFHRRRQ